MDANENANWANNAQWKMKTECNMIDIVEHAGFNIAVDPIFSRGKRRINVILGSQNILNTIVQIHHLPYKMITLSEHKGVILDLDPHILFNAEMSNTTHLTQRNLKLKPPKIININKTYLEEYCQKHKTKVNLDKGVDISSKSINKEIVLQKTQKPLSRGHENAETRCGWKIWKTRNKCAHESSNESPETKTTWIHHKSKGALMRATYIVLP